MMVRLIRDARITHKAGDIVEVSPAVYDFLVSTGSAEALTQAGPEKPAPKKTPKRSTTAK